MRDSSIRDSLTGAYNRAFLTEQLHREIARSRRYEHLCSLMVFDLDHFKSVNDAFGHARGDEILAEVAQRVQNMTRISDLLFRYGGDEFVLLLPHTPKFEAVNLAKRLLEAISSEPFDGPMPLTLSLSIGVATFPADATDEQGLFQKADARSYEAKRRGRACVVGEDTCATPSLPFAERSRLLERDEELGITQHFFADLGSQRRGTLCIIGPTGTGRSRFLSEVEERARLQSFAVLAVHGAPALKAQPYGALAQVLPELSRIPPQQVRLEMLVELLGEYLAAQTCAGLLLSVDNLADLDWATLDLLRQLLSSTALALLGLAYTTDPASLHSAAPFTAPLHARVTMRPLSPVGIRIWLRTLMQWEPSAEFIGWLDRHTHGVPAQIEQLLRHLLAHGTLTKEDQGWQLSPTYVLVDPEAAFPKRQRAIPHNLPAALTSLIGREREIAEVRQLLTTTRLLTLTGPGGMGKTRLSLQVAADVLADFKDGIWFIELAPLSDPALVIATIASVVGVRAEKNRPLAATLLDWLATKQLLLVLDNCEHLLTACAFAADSLLRAAPDVRLLTSSREGLGIAGELIYRVPPLKLPDRKASSPADQVNQYAATQLFIERTVFAQSTFRVSAANAAFIMQICQRLDGIPLAIELAAARMKSLGVEQIAARLDDRFRLLTGGSRTALPRHQTLRSLIDWSHSLLSEPERALLRRLAVFTNGWTLEAAEAVCGMSRADSSEGQLTTLFELPTADVSDLLTNLVDKSLVVAENLAGEPRYRMLETIRHYAREKLLNAQESELLRGRHLAYYLRLAERAEPIIQTAQRSSWLPRLELEHDNIRAALEWACERDVEAGRWLAGTLYWFWHYGDHLSEARTWYERVLAAGDQLVVTKGLALALWGAGCVSTSLLYWETAQRSLEQSILCWKQLGEPLRLAWSLLWLAYLRVFRGEGEGALSIFAEHEALFRASGHNLLLTLVLSYWGRALMHVRHDDLVAKARLDEALALGEQQQDAHGLLTSYLNLGHWALMQDDYGAARHYYLEALTWGRQLGTGWIIADGLRALANVMCLQGDYTQAEPLYTESLALARADGDQSGEANSRQALGIMALRMGELPRATALLDDSLIAYKKCDSPLGIARCLRGFADLQWAQGHPKRAAALLGFVEAWLAANQLNWVTFDRLIYTRLLAAVRGQLDDAAFEAAWQAGQGLTLEQALWEARQASEH